MSKLFLLSVLLILVTVGDCRAATANDGPCSLNTAAARFDATSIQATSGKQLPAANVLFAYLAEGEIQAETEEQRMEIRRGLLDMLEKSPADVRTQRYSDYQGTLEVWSIIQLITAYIVPPNPQSLEPDQFFADLSKPETRAAIVSKLREIDPSLRKHRR